MHHLAVKMKNGLSRCWQWVVLAVYVVVVITVMCFHEPWFDEAQ